MGVSEYRKEEIKRKKRILVKSAEERKVRGTRCYYYRKEERKRRKS